MLAEQDIGPDWLAVVLLAEDDTEESVVGSDIHQYAIGESHAALLDHAITLGSEDAPAWYVSSQVTVITRLPRRKRPWQPKPDVFVVPGVPAHSRTSYDARTEGPMPPFVLEVASESTWQNDVGEKADLYRMVGVEEYLVFDPATQFLGEPMRGWHLVGGVWQPWQPVARASGARVWESAVLGLAVRPEGLLLRFDHPRRGALPVRRELVAALAREQVARRAAEGRERQARREARQARGAARQAEQQAQAAEERARASDAALRAALEEVARLRAHGGETEKGRGDTADG